MINTGTLKTAKIVKGDTFKETLTFYDSKGNPLDLTGYTIYMALKASPDGTGDAAISIDSTGTSDTQGSIVISTNVVTITIFDTATDTLTASSNQLSYLDPKMQEMLNNPGFDYKQLENKNISLYYRDIRFKTLTDEVYTYLNGAVLVFRNITEIP